MKIRLGAGVCSALILGLLTMGAFHFDATEGSAARRGAGSQGGVVGLPDTYNKFLVYVANGIVADAELLIIGDEGIDWFQREVMGRDDDGIAEDRAAALDFFAKRFGLDDVDNNPNVAFLGFAFNPDANYRAYAASEEWVPSTGWVVRDGGWMIQFTADTVLGGEFDGEVAPAGAFVVFGEYNILRDGPGNSAGDPLIIRYQSGSPVVPPSASWDQLSFACELISDEYGAGLAQGLSAPVALGGGVSQQNIRNVLTFSDDMGL